MNNNYITVTQLTRYIKYKIDNDQNLMKIYLKGEISNFKAHTRGHFYFTIKDENTRINAIMFASSAAKVKVMPQDGMKVLVSGRISVYESTGSYQIYVDTLEEDGVGNLYVAFEELKKKLEKEGLFAEAHKKKIPRIPRKIGIITAPTGAAIKDILSTLKRRWPLAETILFPSLVQGKEAAVDIVRNIELAKNYDLDVLIVGRGGGFIEDLWCFNEEIVARAIYDLDIPVISAVGHEIDFTISDFVADLRAPTPTGAAEMAVPNMADLFTFLEQIKIRCTSTISNKININKKHLLDLKDNYVLKNPLAVYEIKEQKLSNIIDTLNSVITNKLANAKLRYNHIKENYILNNPEELLKKKKHDYTLLLNKLEILNPISILSKGYSVVSINDKTINSTDKISKGDVLNIKLYKGSLKAKVESVGK